MLFFLSTIFFRYHTDTFLRLLNSKTCLTNNQAVFQHLEHVCQDKILFIVVKFHWNGSFLAYVPSVAAPRGVYRASYARPRPGYAYGPRPVARAPVPAGRGPGGAGLLAAILGPIGGLTGCLCCLNTIGVWGLFITAIPLTVYMSKSIVFMMIFTVKISNLFIQGRWVASYKNRVSSISGAEELVGPHLLLLVLLVCSFLFTFMRRS